MRLGSTLDVLRQRDGGDYYLIEFRFFETDYKVNEFFIAGFLGIAFQFPLSVRFAVVLTGVVTFSFIELVTLVSRLVFILTLIFIYSTFALIFTIAISIGSSLFLH